MSWVLQIGSIYLSGEATAGGDVTDPATTPIAVRRGWMFQPAKGNLQPQSYAEAVDETIPIAIAGLSADDAATIRQAIDDELASADFSAPAPLIWQPEGAAEALYAEVYGGVTALDAAGDKGVEPVAGGYDVEGTIALSRSP